MWDKYGYAFQRTPSGVRQEAVDLWQMGMPSDRIRTKSAITGLRQAEHPQDDVVLAELEAARGCLNNILDRRSTRLEKESYDERALEREAFGY